MPAAETGVDEDSLESLMAAAREIRDAVYGEAITYSRKVFIPLTRLCRDVCHYCTFATAPSHLDKLYLSVDDCLAIARQGAAAGCKEALFTLGDKPELRYPAARKALDTLGFATTIDYLAHVAKLVRDETGLLPHFNPGLLDADDYAKLRPLGPSMGIMLESSSERLMQKGQAHYGSPDKEPALRLRSIELAGEAKVPMTTGLLIGIGETRAERVDALWKIQGLHELHGHIQEVIIQNFAPKHATKMQEADPCDEEELLWTLAKARLILAPEISLQAPPNLNPGRLKALIDAGINDLGGISPVTIDHVNPEAAWPELPMLAQQCAELGHVLVERATIYPRYVQKLAEWVDKGLHKRVRAHVDGEGFARDSDWSPGEDRHPPVTAPAPIRSRRFDHILARASEGRGLADEDIVQLFSARGGAFDAIVQAADDTRRRLKGDNVTYVVNCNINYTNICTYSCGFCAFSKTSAKGGLRDKPYNLELEDIAERTRVARRAGATEVCLQGGIHPSYTGETYLDILRTIKRAIPDMHVHAFSPLEVSQGAKTLGRSLSDYLKQLKDEGLGSLPGTAAEILADEARAILCPDKLSKREWLEVVGTAHKVGLPTTSTIMFGHVDRPDQWADHINSLRRLQQETGGITEFVPLPYVHMASPLFIKGLARMGPTWRETVLMHAIARLALAGAIDNIQVSWVKLGAEGAAACLDAGVNDLGGVLMYESISRAAGAKHGQEMDVESLFAIGEQAGRPMVQRSTLYGRVENPPKREEGVRAT